MNRRLPRPPGYFAGITGSISQDGRSPPEWMLLVAPAL